MLLDPLELPKFKRKYVLKRSRSPPLPRMYSPPRPVTGKDQQDWKISMNPKGSADGRGCLEVQINDDFKKKSNDEFARLLEVLYVEEQKIREAAGMGSKFLKEMFQKEVERQEQELIALAQQVRSERIVVAPLKKSGVDDADVRVVYEHMDRGGGTMRASAGSSMRDGYGGLLFVQIPPPLGIVL